MQIVRFGDLYAIPSGNGLSRPTAVRGEGYRMIGMGELFANDIINDIEMDRVQMSDREKQSFFVEPDDLLFARQSLVATGAGKCSIVKELKEPTTYESHLIRVRLDKNKCNPWYYYYLFKLPDNPIKAIVNQCAQAGIRGNELVKIKVPLPSRPYQDRIVSVLSTYDNLIKVNNKRIKVLEQMAENLYKEWFVRFRFPGHEKADFENGIPKSWRYCRFAEVFNCVRGVSYSSDEIDCPAGHNLINLKNIQGYGGFKRNGTKKYNGQYKQEQVVKQGDLIMGVTDMTQDRRTVGAVALIPRLQGVISADLVKLESPLNNVFSYCMFRWGNYSSYLSQFGNGANVIHLKPSTLGGIKILIPNEDLIDSFSQKVGLAISQIDILNEQNDNLSKQRDLLLPRLMGGKMEV